MASTIVIVDAERADWQTATDSGGPQAAPLRAGDPRASPGTRPMAIRDGPRRGDQPASPEGDVIDRAFAAARPSRPRRTAGALPIAPR